MRNRPRAFVRDRGVEGGEIDQPHRLRAEDERIKAGALLVELRFDGKLADPVEALLRAGVETVRHQLGGGEIAGILERASQRDGAGAAMVVVARAPIIALGARSIVLPPIGGSMIGSSITSVFGCNPLRKAAR